MRRVAFIALAVACAAPPRVEEADDPSCGRVVLSAVPPPRRRVDLVLSVNGEECRREPLYAGWRGRITRMCGPEWFAPGENRVELTVDPPGCARPVARRAVRCWLPEPD
ncbi:MAG TPA: hypothetical protein VFU21_09140 [Kofleriaceae bacterium]|nr:hypothetical protein [Kofleriaceae bacterium]